MSVITTFTNPIRTVTNAVKNAVTTVAVYRLSRSLDVSADIKYKSNALYLILLYINEIVKSSSFLFADNFHDVFCFPLQQLIPYTGQILKDITSALICEKSSGNYLSG